MRLLPILVAMLMLSLTPVLADQDGPRPDDQDMPGNITIGRGIICDTAKQARRLVSLQDRGSELAKALRQVNREARNATACGPALVAFRIGDDDENDGGQQSDARQPDIMKIIVTAISVNGRQWSPVAAVVQYAVAPRKRIEI